MLRLRRKRIDTPPLLCYTKLGKAVEHKKMWFDDYNKLDLLNGKIRFLSENEEDMIEILYKDGLLIDVGYIKGLTSYFITVVSSDTEEGWKNPLEEIKVENKAELFDKIQETICKYRQKNYPAFVADQFDTMWKWTFFHNFKESRKKYGLVVASALLFLLCIARGLGQKYIWQGSFWQGFLYPFALFFVVFIVSTILYILMKKAPRAGALIAGILLILGVVFLMGIALLVVLLLLNSFLHFWF